MNAPPSPNGPDYVIWEIFFRRVKNLDELATKLDADRNPDAPAWRKHDQFKAGLSDEEGKIMKQVPTIVTKQ